MIELIFDNSNELVTYEDAMEKMARMKEIVLNNRSKVYFWFLEHEHVYTCKNSMVRDLEIKDSQVVVTDRAGKATYHGPGQRICYVVCDIKKINNGILDIRKFVNRLEDIVILTLKDFNIESAPNRDLVGIWAYNAIGEKKKIASIGIKITDGITTHGFALNVNTDMSYFQKIDPCGLRANQMCSMHELLGHTIDMKKVNDSLIKYAILEFKNDNE